MSTPEEKIPRAPAPDDLLPPQVQQHPPATPSAIPVAQPILVAQPQPLVPQLISPQLPQSIAQPIPVAQRAAPQQPQPLAYPTHPVPVAQPITFQPVPPTTNHPAPVAAPVPAAPVPAAPVPAAPVPAAPAPVRVPNSSVPPVSEPAPTRRAPSKEKERRPAAGEQPKEASPAKVASQKRASKPPNDIPRGTRASARRTPIPAKQLASRSKASERPRDTADVPVTAPIVKDCDPTDDSIADSVVGGIPSWLVSSVLHVLVVVLLSLLTLPTFSKNEKVFIEIAYSDEESLAGEELLELPTLDMPIAEPVVLQQLPEVSDPLAAMPILDPNFLGEVAPAEVQAPAIGMALTGREKGMRNALVGKYGGTKATESSVEGGLAWLKRNQQRPGTWSLKGPYNDGSPVENQAAATAMALLAFQGAGNTHLAGDYKEQVARGWQALLKLQKEDGDFYVGDVPNQHLYTHGQATIAICELYGMTKDKAFRDPATRAVAFALQAQSSEGGWRYYPGQGSDTSVTGWYVMALQSALMAGIKVPEENLRRIGKYLDSVQLNDGDRYVYQPLQPETPTMTAEGLLCRQYLGWERDDPRLLSGVEYILSNPVDPQENHDVYYWYYAAQFIHHMEGEAWDRWNNTMRTTIPSLQVTSGKERGSWDPKPDRWSHLGGRLYTTCLSIYMLEVYYRHLPIYSYRN